MLAAELDVIFNREITDDALRGELCKLFGRSIPY
jgi:hypothetical protein